MVTDDPAEMRQIITIALQMNPDRTIHDLSRSSLRNGGLLCSACRLGRLNLAQVLLDFKAGQ